MSTDENLVVSAFRLRVGVVLLLMWWLPFWMLVPTIAQDLNIDSGKLMIVVVGLQTVIGIFGIFVAGSEVKAIYRQTSFKQVPKRMWQLLRSGKLDNS